MPTFNGDISILTVRAIEEDGTLGPNLTAGVAVKKDQVIGGTTTIYNATIKIRIYAENNLPVIVGPPVPPLMVPAPVVLTAAPVPDDVPLYSDVIVTGDDPTTGVAIPWTALLPKNTLTAGQAYSIVAKDSEDSASTTLGITT